MRRLAVRHQQYPVKLYCLAVRRIKKVDIQGLPWLDFELLSTGFDYGVNLRTSRTAHHCSIRTNGASICGRGLKVQPFQRDGHGLLVDPESVHSSLDDRKLLRVPGGIEERTSMRDGHHFIGIPVNQQQRPGRNTPHERDGSHFPESCGPGSEIPGELRVSHYAYLPPL